MGYEIELFSPKGGKLEGDQYSDPRGPCGYSDHDLISMGFINTPKLAGLLENTKRVSDIQLADFECIFIAGGQSPMFTYQDEHELHKKFVAFYEAGKIASALCHGTCILRYAKLSNGTYLVKGRIVTGFAKVEEDFSDAFVGQKLMLWRIEDELKKTGIELYSGWSLARVCNKRRQSDYRTANYSGAATARLVIEALGL